MKDRVLLSIFTVSILVCGCKTEPMTWPVESVETETPKASPAPQPIVVNFQNFPILPKSISDSIASMTLGVHTGTGLIFRASNSVYLVTARHVIFDSNTTNNPALWTLVHTQAVVTTYVRDNEEMVPRTMTLDLNILTAIQEVRFPFNHDIALIRFEECSTNDDRIVRTLPGVHFTSTHKDLFPLKPAFKKFEDIIIGSDVVTFGYPTDIGVQDAPQIDRKQPLLRKGIIAGVNNDLRRIVIDSAAYGGFSGGPIFLRETDNMTYCNFYIVGIQTEVVPARLKFVSGLVNSGYAMAEPIDIILTGIWK